MFRTDSLPEGEIYAILANGRRREALRRLTEAGDGVVSLDELATAIAAGETGQSPPPRAARESVRGSLHQTHLPKLDELGVVGYDRDAGSVHLREGAREVDRYLTVFTPYGLSWGEVYRGLGIGSLLVVLAALLEAPVVGAVDPLLWVSASLAAFAGAVASQLWSNRWYVLRALRG